MGARAPGWLRSCGPLCETFVGTTLVTHRTRARRTLLAGLGALCILVASTSAWPATAQTKRTSTTTTSTTEPSVTIPVAPGQTAPNGGPLLVPGDVTTTTAADAGDTTNNDNTGTVVALVISGLLVVALLLALLTYWFWRNTRPGRVSAKAAAADGDRTEGAEGKVTSNG